MSGQKKLPNEFHPRKEAHQHKLNHFLGFGPEEAKAKDAKPTGDANDRLKKLLRQLEDLNKRVDKLYHHL